MIFKKGEFFNGPGGLALGARMAKIVDKNGKEYRVEHQWANDIDESACETFRKNICPDRPESVINQDVRMIIAMEEKEKALKEIMGHYIYMESMF